METTNVAEVTCGMRPPEAAIQVVALYAYLFYFYIPMKDNTWTQVISKEYEGVKINCLFYKSDNHEL